MEVQYYKNYSPALGRDMECKIYGHAGRPVLFIPCQDGRFFDFENFHMTDVWSPWIESGEVMIFSIDTIDAETWSDQGGDPRWRICRYEQWIQYITDELVPFMRAMANERNGWSGYPGILVFGCSLGATHAANLYYRRPDLFDRLLALSGIYTSEYGFGNYMDDLVISTLRSTTFRICRKIIHTSKCTINRNPSSVWDKDHGKSLNPQDKCSLSFKVKESIPGWISGAMTVHTTGIGGTSR